MSFEGLKKKNVFLPFIGENQITSKSYVFLIKKG